MNLTKEQFIERECTTWGSDYIYNLIDRGYTPVLVYNEEGALKWTWVYSPQASYVTHTGLTNTSPYGMVNRGSGSVVTPVRSFRASG